MNGKLLITLLLVFMSCSFFGFLHPALYKYTPIISLMLGVTYLSKDVLFKKELTVFFIFILASAFSCSFFRGQDIGDTLFTDNYFNFYCLALYFALYAIKPSIKDLNRIIIICYIIFFVIYIVQYIYYPNQIVTLLVNNEKEHRFRIFGQLINSLGYFYCLCKYIKTKKNIYLILCFIGILTIFLLAFRTMLLAVLIVTFFAYFRSSGISIKKILPLCIAMLIFYYGLSNIPAVSASLERMVEANNEQSYGNSDYIRWIQLDYFMEYHFINPIERILGSGMPGKFSRYGQMFMGDEVFSEDTAIYAWVDWGLIGLSWVIGPIAVIALIFIWVKCIKISYVQDIEYQFVAYWLVFLLLISINNIEIYRIGGFGFHALIMYYVSSLKYNH